MLALFAATQSISCAGDPARVEESDLESRISSGDPNLDLYYDAYDLFLDKTFPLDVSAQVSVQMYKDLPAAGEPDDLELSFSVIQNPFSASFQIRVLLADAVPVVHQVFELAEKQSGQTATQLLSRVQLVQRRLGQKECPSFFEHYNTWQADWFSTAVPDLTMDEEQIIRVHPWVIRVAVQNADRITSIETTDPEDPVFRWGVEAARHVRSCVLSRPAA